MQGVKHQNRGSFIPTELGKRYSDTWKQVEKATVLDSFATPLPDNLFPRGVGLNIGEGELSGKGLVTHLPPGILPKNAFRS